MSLPLRLYSPISRLVTRSRRRAIERGRLIQRTAPLPVISVGNIAFGGSGKTPLALALLGDLVRFGRRPAFVSRGYRGAWEDKGGVVADGRILATWRQAGDEPFMVARAMPGAGVFVGRDRLASCVRAREAGFDVAVLDDAFQHLRLARLIDIVLYDPGPRRPLRESPSALRRAGAVLVPRSVDSKARSRLEAFLRGVPLFDYAVEPHGLIEAAPPPATGPARPPSRLQPGGIGSARQPAPIDASSTEALRGRPIVAVCGIARPERFFATLESIGFAPAARLAFPDHHAYPLASRARIARAAECAAGNRLPSPASASGEDASAREDEIGEGISGAAASGFGSAAGQPAGGPVIVTTEKDLPKLEGAPELAGIPLFALQIRLDVSPGLFDLIRSALGTR